MTSSTPTSVTYRSFESPSDLGLDQMSTARTSLSDGDSDHPSVRLPHPRDILHVQDLTDHRVCSLFLFMRSRVLPTTTVTRTSPLISWETTTYVLTLCVTGSPIETLFFKGPRSPVRTYVSLSQLVPW